MGRRNQTHNLAAKYLGGFLKSSTLGSTDHPRYTRQNRCF
ncbi:hypothetical protein VCHENC02_5729A, partial [Vibrio harveyi]